MTKDRIIKFRAWDKEGKRMLFENEQLWDTNDADYVLGVCSDGLVIRELDAGVKTMYDVELMQFTGLHDKNGKEIYEGDIVHWGSSDWYVNYGGVPGGKLLSAGYYAVSTDDKETFYVFDNFKNLEVIGNIYENPDLNPKSDIKKGER